MTKLAQLNDCHSCNDARSMVQKKKSLCKRCLSGSPRRTEVEKSLNTIRVWEASNRGLRANGKWANAHKRDV